MPNTKSAIRRVRRVKKQTTVNRSRKGKYRSAIKQMEKLIKEGKKNEAKKFFPKFQTPLNEPHEEANISMNSPPVLHFPEGFHWFLFFR